MEWVVFFFSKMGLQEVSVAKYVVGVHIVLYRLEHAQTNVGDSLPHPLLPQLAH